MKNFFKRLIIFIKQDCFKLILKIHFRWQLKYKLDNSKERINTDYKKDIKKYWKKYNVNVTTNWHKWYSSVNGKKDLRYIPEDLFYCDILPYYNRFDFGRAYADKALYSYWFSKATLPLTIAKNMNGICYDDNFKIITLDDVLARCEKYKKVIIKATIDSGAGKNIEVINASTAKEMRMKIEEILLLFKKDYVIQEVIEQHETLKKLNPSSVNTIRVTSFLHKNEVHVLTSHLRIGNKNSIFDHNGVVCGIKDNGQLQNFAITYKQGEVLTEHPDGFKFGEIHVPGFQEIKDIIKMEHLKFGHFKIISWDFAVGADGNPILIEFNLRYQGLNHHQLTIGPLFGELTGEVLEEVYN